jgi:hypothetical protein
MRLHSDTLTESDVRDALDRAKRRGHVDRLVVFSELVGRGSRTRKNGFEIRLEWLGDKQKGDGRRYTNSGNGGAGTSAYAALYSEWGWFIAELFDKDADAVFGNYKGRDDFDNQTRWQFEISTAL